EKVVGDLTEYRAWADPLLRDAWDQANPDQRLRIALALLPADEEQADYLFDRLLDATPAEMPVLVRALRPHAEGRLERLWQAAQRPPTGMESRRLRVACALAAYDPGNPRWDQVAEPVVAQLVAENSLHRAGWVEGFRPVGGKLFVPLARRF